MGFFKNCRSSLRTVVKPSQSIIMSYILLYIYIPKCTRIVLRLFLNYLMHRRRFVNSWNALEINIIAAALLSTTPPPATPLTQARRSRCPTYPVGHQKLDWVPPIPWSEQTVAEHIPYGSPCRLYTLVNNSVVYIYIYMWGPRAPSGRSVAWAHLRLRVCWPPLSCVRLVKGSIFIYNLFFHTF